MQSSNLKIGKPNVGWLPIEIKIGDFALSFEASDLGLNVIDQLIDMVRSLNDGKTSQCYFYLEPGAYILKVETIVKISILEIQFLEDFNNEDISAPEIQFQSKINLVEFNVSLTNALRTFQNFEYEMEDWPIPEKRALLSEILN